MGTSRRTLIKQLGLGIASLGMTPFSTHATPAFTLFDDPMPPDGPIRLSSNENPYGPSPMARAAMAASIGISNRYSWNTAEDLLAAIALKNNVGQDNLLITAGSTAALDLVSMTAAAKKGSMVVATPSYTGWTRTAERFGLRKIAVPLTADKRHDLPAMLSAIEPDTQLVYICNPNNPTGTICERTALVSFIEEATKKATVLIDEAYTDFAEQESVCGLAVHNPNLVVVRTFSKIYGLAGARIGYAIGHKDTIDQLSGLQSWSNGGVSVVSRAAAIASLRDSDFVQQCRAKNTAARKYTIEQLTALNIICIPSYTNFLYFSLARYPKDYLALLKSHNIQGTGIWEETGQWSRITMGTMEEMKQFIAAIQ